MTWHRLSMNKIWVETHVEDTTHIKDKFKQVKYVYVPNGTKIGLGYDPILVPVSETLFLNKDWTMDNVQKTNNGTNYEAPNFLSFCSLLLLLRF
jgi:hypothetical protein